MTRKLNIAQVAACPFPANRGTPSRILGMAEGLIEKGHNIHVVTYHYGISRKTGGIYIHRIPRMPYHYFPPGPTITKFALLDPLLFFKLLQVVKKQNIDLIHAHHFEGAMIGYVVRRITGTQVIYDAHTSLESELAYYKGWNLKHLSRWLDAAIPQRADYIITVSDSLKDFILSQGIGECEIDVIPTGVNFKHFEAATPGDVKDRYQFNGKQIVMYAGSMAPFQGIGYLFDAMKIVLEQRPQTIMVLVGGTAAKKNHLVEIQSNLQDRIIMIDEPPFQEIPGFLAAADVVVLPRVNCAGIPQKLTNYMAAQKAIVSFESSAKLLTHKHDGWIVKDGSTEAMGDAIITLLKNKALREKLGRNAKLTLTGRYDWDSLCTKLETIYFRMLQ